MESVVGVTEDFGPVPHAYTVGSPKRMFWKVAHAAGSAVFVKFWSRVRVSSNIKYFMYGCGFVLFKFLSKGFEIGLILIKYEFIVVSVIDCFV